MANIKTLLTFGLIALLATSMAAHAQTPVQDCPRQLVRLETCAPFALPGAAAPNATCCSAIGSMDNGCLCNTLDIVSRLPSLCNMPRVNCPAAN